MSQVYVKLMVDAAVANGGDFDAITLRKCMILPFLPRIGDMLGVGADCDSVKVDEVFWSEKDSFVIWLEDIDKPRLTQIMLAQGWVEA